MKKEFCWKSFAMGMGSTALVSMFVAGFWFSNTIDGIEDYGRAHKWEMQGLVKKTCEQLTNQPAKCLAVLCSDRP